MMIIINKSKNNNDKQPAVDMKEGKTRPGQSHKVSPLLKTKV